MAKPPKGTDQLAQPLIGHAGNDYFLVDNSYYYEVHIDGQKAKWSQQILGLEGDDMFVVDPMGFWIVVGVLVVMALGAWVALRWKGRLVLN